MSGRNEAFDAAKGMLIIFVILGHVLLGSISQNVGREIIYFFHMPVFLAITGYFIKQSMLMRSFSDIFKKYTYRLIIPFAIAFVFYTVSILVVRDELNFKNIVGVFLYPYYHLWYVPAVILFVFIAVP